MTAAIDSLLATRDGVRRSDIRALGPFDIADLAARAANPFDPNSLRALNTLAAAAMHDPNLAIVLSPIVTGVLARPDLDPLTRAAVLSYAAAAHLDALTLLLAAAADPDGDIAIAAWRALQFVARSADLATLQQSLPPPGSGASAQAAFTMSLVASRGGVAGFELPVLDDTHIRAIPNDEVRLFPILQSATTAQDFALVTDLSVTELYLVAVQLEATTTIDCGEQHMLVCLDPDIMPGFPATLVQAPAMPGIITVQDPLGTSCGVRFLLLTQPDGAGGFFGQIYQAGGELMYQGHASAENISDSSATLSLFSLDQPGLRPIALEVSIGAGGMQLVGEGLSAIERMTDPMEPTPDF